MLVAAHLSSSNNSHNYVTALLDQLCHEKKLNHSLQIKIMDPWINLVSVTMFFYEIGKNRFGACII